MTRALLHQNVKTLLIANNLTVLPIAEYNVTSKVDLRFSNPLVVIPPCSIWQWYKVGEFSSSERKRATRARADGLAFRGFALPATRATPTKGYFMVDI